MDEILEKLEKTNKKNQKIFDESEQSAIKQIKNYENILKSKETSETQKIKAHLVRSLEVNRLENLSSRLRLTYIIQIFAFKVKILQISINKIKDQIAKSEMLEKTKNIEEIEKKIDKLMILLEAQHESINKIGGDFKKDLGYVS